MKNLLFIFSLLLFLSCGQKTSNEITTGKRSGYENFHKTLFKLIKESPYNENGYALLIDEYDEFGHANWVISSPVYKYDLSIVTRIKKYRTYEDFWNSEWGDNIQDRQISCIKELEDGEICFIN